MIIDRHRSMINLVTHSKCLQLLGMGCSLIVQPDSKQRHFTATSCFNSPALVHCVHVVSRGAARCASSTCSIDFDMQEEVRRTLKSIAISSKQCHVPGLSRATKQFSQLVYEGEPSACYQTCVCLQCCYCDGCQPALPALALHIDSLVLRLAIRLRDTCNNS